MKTTIIKHKQFNILQIYLMALCTLFLSHSPTSFSTIVFSPYKRETMDSVKIVDLPEVIIDLLEDFKRKKDKCWCSKHHN